jgi:hypothetical protein
MASNLANASMRRALNPFLADRIDDLVIAFILVGSHRSRLLDHTGKVTLLLLQSLFCVDLLCHPAGRKWAKVPEVRLLVGFFAKTFNVKSSGGFRIGERRVAAY